MKKDKQSRLDKAIFALKETVSDSANLDTENLNSVIKDLEEISTIHKKADKGLDRLLMIIAIILSVIGIHIFMLYDRNDALEYRIQNYEYRDSLFSVLMGLDSTKTITWRVKNGEPITYKQLEHSVDSLAECKLWLDLILKNYPITTSKNGNIYSIQSKQIDSALLILPMYRDMIKYNPKTKEWVITRMRYE